MSVGARIDGPGPEDQHGIDTMASQFADELVVLPGSPSSDVILDLTSDAAVAVPAPVLNDADDVLDGFQDPVMPVVILGLITFFAIIAIAAMLAL